MLYSGGSSPCLPPFHDRSAPMSLSAATLPVASPARRRWIASLLATVTLAGVVPGAWSADPGSDVVDAASLEQGSMMAFRRAVAAAKPSTDDLSIRRLRGIATRIVVAAQKVTGNRPSPAPNAALVNAEAPDLRVYPGAHVLATAPFLVRLDLTDDEIAAVLAQLVALGLADDLAWLRDHAKADDLRSPDPNRRALATADAIERGMQDRKPTAGATAKADELSTRIAAAAGYDPRAAATAWRKLAQRNVDLVRAQPVTPERLAALEAAGAQAVAAYEATRRAPRPEPPAGLRKSK